MKKLNFAFLVSPLIAMLLCSNAAVSQTRRWSEQKANDWYAQQPWLVGSNYIPKSAINQLEMWQEATFDPAEIDKELGWAEGLGMNTMRVFLHDLLWQQDAPGFRKRIDQFLDDRRRAITSARCSCCSIPAGTPRRSWARSMLPFPACTIPAGCRVRGPRRWPIPANIRG